MRRLLSVALVAAGLAAILLGLLFLAGAAGKGRRVVIGLAGLAMGAAAAGAGVLSWKRADSLSPGRIRDEILDLARRRNGEISQEDVQALLGDRASRGAPVLRSLVDGGICRRSRSGAGDFYVFPSLQPRLMVQRCPYCDREFELSEEVGKCPNCGGTVERKISSVSMSDGEHFNMDAPG